MKYYGHLMMLFLICFSGPSFATITLTEISSPTLGIVYAGATSRQFVLNPNSSVAGPDSADYISGAAAGNITVEDNTSPVSINITANNIVTAGGITVPQIHCTYNGGTDTRCDGSGYNVTSVSSATLLIGFFMTTNQAHVGGDTATADFDIVITYN